MNVLKSLLLVVFAALLTAQTASAQKFGHLNSGNLLELMPEVKAANDALKVYGGKLETRRDSLAKVFQDAYTAYAKAAQEGTVPPKEAQVKEAELQKMQDAGQQFETAMQQLVGAQRDALLSPILKKVDDAIKAVGKEGNYLFIFDTSTGATLYALESEDVMPLVKTKLGI